MNSEQVTQYWIERGKTYVNEEMHAQEFYRSQEQLFLEVVEGFKPKHVLDVGCGFGRITKVLAGAMPNTQVVGFDVSSDQLANAWHRCGLLDNVDFFIHNVFLKEKIPPSPGRYDVAVCAEVLLHIPKEDIERVIRKILVAAPVLIHDVDPSWREEDAVSGHCVYHNYLGLYRRMDLTVRSVCSSEHTLLVVEGGKI